MPELIVRHIDDVPWQEVRAVVDRDGKRLVAREKWVEFTPQRLAHYGVWDPGMVVHRHGHNSEQIIFVIAGELTVGDRVCPAGTYMVLEQGAAMGPMIAGPEGVVLFEAMMGDPRSWPDDPEGYERLLAERGLTKLPNPPVEMPDWLPDTRSP